MQGGRNKTGTRGNGDGTEELDEFFADRDEQEDQLSEEPSEKTTLSDEEEIRRLSAYVAHLKERVAEHFDAMRFKGKNAQKIDNAFKLTPYILVGIAVIISTRFFGRRNTGW